MQRVVDHVDQLVDVTLHRVRIVHMIERVGSIRERDIGRRVKLCEPRRDVVARRHPDLDPAVKTGVGEYAQVCEHLH